MGACKQYGCGCDSLNEHWAKPGFCGDCQHYHNERKPKVTQPKTQAKGKKPNFYSNTSPSRNENNAVALGQASPGIKAKVASLQKSSSSPDMMPSDQTSSQSDSLFKRFLGKGSSKKKKEDKVSSKKIRAELDVKVKEKPSLLSRSKEKAPQISGPTNVQHVGHLGFGQDNTIMLKNLPEEMAAALQTIRQALEKKLSGPVTQEEMVFFLKDPDCMKLIYKEVDRRRATTAKPPAAHIGAHVGAAAATAPSAGPDAAKQTKGSWGKIKRRFSKEKISHQDTSKHDSTSSTEAISTSRPTSVAERMKAFEKGPNSRPPSFPEGRPTSQLPTPPTQVSKPLVKSSESVPLPAQPASVSEDAKEEIQKLEHTVGQSAKMIAALRSECKSLQTLYQEASHDKRKLGDDLEAVRKELADLKAVERKTTFQSRLSRAVPPPSSGLIENKLKEDVLNLRQEAKQREKQLTMKESEVTTLKDKLSKLEEDISSSKLKVTATEATLKDRECEITQLLAQLEKEKEKQLQSEKKVESLSAELESSRALLQKNTTSESKQSEIVTSLQNQSKGLSEELEALRSVKLSSDQELEDANKTIKALRSELISQRSELESQLSAEKREGEHLKQDIENEKYISGELRTEINSLREALSSTRAKASELEAKLLDVGTTDELEAALQEASRTWDDERNVLLEEIKEGCVQREEQGTEIRKQRDEIARLNKLLEAKDKEVTTLQNKAFQKSSSTAGSAAPPAVQDGNNVVAPPIAPPAPAPPAAPPAPPPVPPSGAWGKLKAKVGDSDTRGALLAAIRSENHQLRHVTEEEQQQKAADTDGSDVVNILAQALMDRRLNMKEEKGSDHSESSDEDDAW